METATGNARGDIVGRMVSILLLARYGMLFYEELKEGRAGMSKEEREQLRQQNVEKKGWRIEGAKSD